MSIYDNAGVVQIPSGYKAGTTDNLYSVLPANGNGDFNATRGSTATRVNKDGFIESVATNVPRLDYPLIDGVVQDCPALLLEPSETNYQIRSEEFDNSAYQKTRSSITANQIVSPDGTLTADLFTEDTSNNSHYLYDTLVVSADSYTVSVFAKAKDRYKIKLRFDNVSTRRVASFDLNSGSIISTSNSTATIKQFPNNWYRCSITVTATAETFYNFIHILDDSGNEGYAGDGSSGLYIWGSQIERSSYLTSYIKTTSSQATRSADVCNKSGVESLLGQTEGTLFLEFVPLDTSALQILFQIRTTGSTNVGQVDIRFQSSQIRAFGSDNSGTTQFSIAGGSITAGTNYKAAIRYKTNDAKFYINGSSVGTDTSCSFTSSTKQQISFAENLSSFLPSIKVKQAIVFDEALSDSELATLTS